MRCRHPGGTQARQDVSLFLGRVNLPVYLAPIQLTPAGPSRGAAVILSIQPLASKDSKREPRLGNVWESNYMT
jgi:hypothetical protein